MTSIACKTAYDIKLNKLMCRLSRKKKEYVRAIDLIDWFAAPLLSLLIVRQDNVSHI
jgi:hypothetical protein